MRPRLTSTSSARLPSDPIEVTIRRRSRGVEQWVRPRRTRRPCWTQATTRSRLVRPPSLRTVDCWTRLEAHPDGGNSHGHFNSRPNAPEGNKLAEQQLHSATRQSVPPHARRTPHDSHRASQPHRRCRGRGESSSGEEHLTWTQLASSQWLLDEIDDALTRIDNNTYGECEDCGNPIAPERLETIPHARRCVTCQGRSHGSSTNR